MAQGIQRVLVTGGTGFIGDAVCRNLAVRGIEPIVFDRHSKGGNKPPAYERRFGDVRDFGAVYEAVYNSDAVIHLAAMLGTQETIHAAREAAEVNVFGSLNVFNCVKELAKPAVYIAVGNHWMNNPYAITKTTAERFAFMYNKEFGTEISVVRGMNAYGPGQKPRPVRKIMPNLILPALRGDPITIYGDGTQIMDMIYVDDLAEILVRALLMPHGVYDRSFEAGMGEDTTVNDLARLVVELTGSTSEIRHVPMRPGEIPNSVVRANTSLVEDRLDYTPPTGLLEGISHTIGYYRDFVPSAP